MGCSHSNSWHAVCFIRQETLETSPKPPSECLNFFFCYGFNVAVQWVYVYLQHQFNSDIRTGSTYAEVLTEDKVQRRSYITDVLLTLKWLQKHKTVCVWVSVSEYMPQLPDATRWWQYLCSALPSAVGVATCRWGSCKAIATNNKSGKQEENNKRGCQTCRLNDLFKNIPQIFILIYKSHFLKLGILARCLLFPCLTSSLC